MKLLLCFLFLFSCLLLGDSPFSKSRLEEFYEEFVCDEKESLSDFELDTACAANPLPPPPEPPNPPNLDGFIPFTVFNGTGTRAPSQVFALILVNNSTQVIEFTEQNGHLLGSLTTPTPTLGTESTFFASAYAKSLDFFEELSPGFFTFYLPDDVIQAGSRMYFSIDKPLNWTIALDGTTQEQNVYDVRNPTYYSYYDKLEYTITNVSLPWFQLVMNATFVDFYALPLSFFVQYDSQSPPLGPTTKFTGLSPTIARQTVFSTYGSQLSTLPGSGADSWARLLSTHTFPNGVNADLRINSSNVSIGQTATPTTNPDLLFPKDYLASNPNSGCQWFLNVWKNGANTAFYQTNPLIVTTTLDGTDTASGVINASGEFVFTVLSGPETGGVVTLKNPVTTPWINEFAPFFNSVLPAADFTVTAPATTATANAIWQLFSNAFIVGFHPIAGTSMADPLTQEYLRSRIATYFNDNPSVGCPGPWFDFYSKVLLKDLAIPPYTEYFTTPFGDILGVGGLITVDNAPVAKPQVFITVGSLSGSQLPSLFDDDALYDVHCVGVGANSTATLNGQPFTTGTLIQDVTGSDIELAITYMGGTFPGTWPMQIAPSVPLADPIIPGGAPAITLDTGTTPPTVNITIGAAP